MVGAVNALFTLTIYQVVNSYFPYWIAYTVAFFTGVLFSYLGNAYFTFSVLMSRRKFTVYGLFYLMSYCLGLSLSIYGVEVWNIGERIIPFIVLSAMIPFNFFGAKTILEKVR